MALSRRIVRGIQALLVANAIRLLGKGLLLLVLARVLLTPEQYGLLYLAINVLSVALIASAAGIPKSAGRFVAEYRETDPSQVPHIVRTSVRYVLVAVAVVGAVLFASADGIASLLGEPRLGLLLRVGVVYLAAQTIVESMQILFQGFNRVTYSAVLRSFYTVVQLGLVVGFVVLWSNTLGAMLGFVVSAALAAVLGLSVLYWRLYRNYDAAETVDAGLKRRLLRYSVPLTATRSANVLDKRIDILLVGYFLSPLAVGFYTLAKQIADFVMTPAGVLGFTLSPTFGEQKAAGDRESARRLYQSTLEHVLLLYVPAAAGIALTAEPAVTLIFGADYAGAIPVLQVMSGFVVLQSITFVTSDALDYLGRARERAIVKGATAAANFGLNLVMIPLFGVVGAAAATVATHSVYSVVNLYVMHLELSLSVGSLLRSFGKVLGVAAAMSVSVASIAPHVSTLVELLLVILFGASVWALVAVASGLLDVDRLSRLVT